MKYREVGVPRTNSVAVLFRHHANDLGMMPKVMRQLLLKRNRAEFWVRASQLQVIPAQLQPFQLLAIPMAQLRKKVQKLAKRLVLVRD